MSYGCSERNRNTMLTHLLMTLMALLLVLTLRMESIADQRKSLKAILADKRDHRRVLLIYGRDGSTGGGGQQMLLEQQENLIEHEAGLQERDMDVIVLTASEVPEPDRQFLMAAPFKLVPSADYMAWLIGKDGGIKKVYNKPAPVNNIFALIDGMPMRQQEMKKQ